jgi:hypothetical protein
MTTYSSHVGYTYVYTNIHIWARQGLNVFFCTCANMYVYLCICTCVCMCTCVFVHVHVCIYVRVYIYVWLCNLHVYDICMCIWVHLYMCICICVSLHLCTCAPVYLYMRICTNTKMIGLNGYCMDTRLAMILILGRGPAHHQTSSCLEHTTIARLLLLPWYTIPKTTVC